MKKLLVLFLLFTISINADRGIQKLREMRSEARVALVIGNNDYKSETLPKLHNPINDAKAIKNILSQRGFEVIYAENTSSKTMKKRLKLFYKKIRNGGVGFLYFSGHGLEFDGENYLIPVDANIEEKDDVDIDSISVNSITKKMQRANNRLNIVVLDACRNDPFSRGGTGGLVKVEPEGIFVAYATSAGKVASDGKRGSNGLFTKHLIKYMKKDGLGLYEVFKKTRESVYVDSDKKQRPAIYDQVIGEEFFFTLPTKNSYKPQKKSSFSFKNEAPTTFSMSINPTPYDAKVSITNIKPKYYDGIRLKKGTYNIKVSKNGYITKKGKVDLESDFSADIVLEKVTSYTPHKSSSKTWKDKDTGLIWQVKIDKKMYNWNDAKEYCRDLTLDGYSNWKLPTKDELKTIMTKTSYKNTKSFSGKTYIKKPLLKSMSMEWQSFWSSTSKNSSEAWVLNFYNGNDFYYSKSYGGYVRCVVGRQ